MYQLGFDCQAMPSRFWVKGAAGAKWVALLFGRQSPGEARDAGDRFQPNAAVGDCQCS
jgi:hypothetical protein